MSNISGTRAADTIAGSSSPDLIFGRHDNDLIDGQEGDDVIHGSGPARAGQGASWSAATYADDDQIHGGQ
jgi:hypothetical protein